VVQKVRNPNVTSSPPQIAGYQGNVKLHIHSVISHMTHMMPWYSVVWQSQTLAHTHAEEGQVSSPHADLFHCNHECSPIRLLDKESLLHHFLWF